MTDTRSSDPSARPPAAPRALWAIGAVIVIAIVVIVVVLVTRGDDSDDALLQRIVVLAMSLTLAASVGSVGLLLAAAGFGQIRVWSRMSIVVTFLGLLVANVAYVLLRTHEHRWLLPGAALVSVLFLVAGQVVLEHVLGFDTTLGVVIELVGGIVFIVLLLRGVAR